MDSTTVALLTKAATDLGMTGAQAFGWYLAVKVVSDVLWAAAFVTVALFVMRTINKNLAGTRWMDAVGVYESRRGKSATALEDLVRKVVNEQR